MSKSIVKSKSSGRARRRGGKEREWRRIIDEQRRCGESVRVFCRGRGVRESSFYRWRREIGLRDREAGSKQQKKTSPPVLAPVVFVDEAREASTDKPSALIEIVLEGGTTVRVPPDSTRTQLAVVLGVLGQAQC